MLSVSLGDWFIKPSRTRSVRANFFFMNLDKYINLHTQLFA
jgi:hypothetical protein